MFFQTKYLSAYFFAIVIARTLIFHMWFGTSPPVRVGGGAQTMPRNIPAQALCYCKGKGGTAKHVLMRISLKDVELPSRCEHWTAVCWS